MKPNPLIPELAVSDIKKSVQFYMLVLGFIIEYEREEDGFAYIAREGSQIMLDQIGKSRTWKTAPFEYPLGRGINLQIEVSNVDKLFRHVQKHSIPVFLDLEEKWYRKDNVLLGVKQFALQDPDGYLLRFSEDLGEKELNRKKENIKKYGNNSPINY